MSLGFLPPARRSLRSRGRGWAAGLSPRRGSGGCTCRRRRRKGPVSVSGSGARLLPRAGSLPPPRGPAPAAARSPARPSRSPRRNGRAGREVSEPWIPTPLPAAAGGALPSPPLPSPQAPGRLGREGAPALNVGAAAGPPRGTSPRVRRPLPASAPGQPAAASCAPAVRERRFPRPKPPSRGAPLPPAAFSPGPAPPTGRSPPGQSGGGGGRPAAALPPPPPPMAAAAAAEPPPTPPPRPAVGRWPLSAVGREGPAARGPPPGAAGEAGSRRAGGERGPEAALAGGAVAAPRPPSRRAAPRLAFPAEAALASLLPLAGARDRRRRETETGMAVAEAKASGSRRCPGGVRAQPTPAPRSLFPAFLAPRSQCRPGGKADCKDRQAVSAATAHGLLKRALGKSVYVVQEKYGNRFNVQLSVLLRGGCFYEKKPCRLLLV